MPYQGAPVTAPKARRQANSPKPEELCWPAGWVDLRVFRPAVHSPERPRSRAAGAPSGRQHDETVARASRVVGAPRHLRGASCGRAAGTAGAARAEGSSNTTTSLAGGAQPAFDPALAGHATRPLWAEGCGLFCRRWRRRRWPGRLRRAAPPETRDTGPRVGAGRPHATSRASAVGKARARGGGRARSARGPQERALRWRPPSASVVCRPSRAARAAGARSARLLREPRGAADGAGARERALRGYRSSANVPAAPATPELRRLQPAPHGSRAPDAGPAHAARRACRAQAAATAPDTGEDAAQGGGGDRRGWKRREHEHRPLVIGTHAQHTDGHDDARCLERTTQLGSESLAPGIPRRPWGPRAEGAAAPLTVRGLFDGISAPCRGLPRLRLRPWKTPMTGETGRWTP